MTQFGPISAIELPKKNLEDAYVIESTSTALPGPGTFGKYKKKQIPFNKVLGRAHFMKHNLSVGLVWASWEI